MRRSLVLVLGALLCGCGASERTEPVRPAEPRLANGSSLADLNGFEIHYEIHGDGPILMTLPNSWGLSLEGLRAAYLPLEAHLTMVYFDPRGMDGSGAIRTDADMGMAAVRADFQTLREHLGLRRVNAIGWSNGATNLILLASEDPDTLERTVFLRGEAAFTDDDMRMLQENHPGLMAIYAEFLATMEDPELTAERADERVKRFSVERYFPMLSADRAAAPEMLRALFDDAEFSWAHSRYASREMPTYDLRDRLPQITSPSLVIAGRHDLLPVTRAEAMTASLPDARLVIFEQSGHFAPAEERERFVETVVSFLSQ